MLLSDVGGVPTSGCKCPRKLVEGSPSSLLTWLRPTNYLPQPAITCDLRKAHELSSELESQIYQCVTEQDKRQAHSSPTTERPPDSEADCSGRIHPRLR